MFRLVFYAVLLVLLFRAVLRMWRGLAEGLAGGAPRGGVTRSVQMVRDPVCGTFVVPDRAVTLAVGDRLVHFCSATCRERYRVRPR